MQRLKTPLDLYFGRLFTTGTFSPAAVRALEFHQRPSVSLEVLLVDRVKPASRHIDAQILRCTSPK